jgi:hypothetical protein
MNMATQCVQDIVCKSAVGCARMIRIFVAASDKFNVYECVCMYIIMNTTT